MQIKHITLSDSGIGAWAQKFSYPLLSEFFILASVFIFWYEGTFQTYNLATILLVLALVVADKSKIKISRSSIYLVVFSVVTLLTGLLATSRGIDARLVVTGWVLYLQFLIAVLAAQGVASPRRLLKNIIFAAIPLTLVGAYQYYARQITSPLWVTPAEASISTRAFAFFGSPNVLGAVLAIMVLTAAGLYLETKNRLFALMACFSTFVLVLTFSRSAWIALMVGALAIIVIKNVKLVYFAPLVSLPLLFTQVRERVSVVFTPGYWLDSSLDGRLWAVNNGIHIWSKYPMFGSGPGTYGGKLALINASPVYLQGIQSGYVALYYTDNQWLQLLVQTGLVGVILFALFVVNVIVELLSMYNSGRDWVALGVVGAFVAFCITGIFGNVLEFGAIAVPMGIILGVASRGK